MTPAGFEPPIPANKRPQIHSLARVDTGLGSTHDSRLRKCI